MNLKALYKPKGKAGEYSPGLALNLFTGCPHRCVYCYAPLVLHKDREQFHSVVEPRKNILENLKADLEKIGKVDEPIFLCFTCDPFPWGYEALHGLTWDAIRLIHQSRNAVRILTKNPGAIDPTRLTMTNDEVWTTFASPDYIDYEFEPKTQSPNSRIRSLDRFSNMGFKTGISFEPIISFGHVALLLKDCIKHNHFMNFGKFNYPGVMHEDFKKLIMEINWQKVAIGIHQAMQETGYTNYRIKDDLRAYLPAEMKAIEALV